jgi:uncharacterized protein (DUF1778 family)
MPRTAIDRLEFRVQPELKTRIQHAADLLQVPVSDFVRSAAELQADHVLREHAATVVAPDFFDAIVAALDDPPEPSPALARAARRVSGVQQR